MKHAALAGLALFAAPAFAAEGDTLYRDADTKFAIIVPAGWTAEKPDPKAIGDRRVFVNGPLWKEVCIVSVNEFPYTAEFSQQHMDDMFVRTGLLRDNYWKLRSLGLPVSFEVVSGEIADLNGHLAQISVWKGKEGNGLQVEGRRMETASIPVPGRLYEVMCTAEPKDLEAATPTLRRILRSFVVLP